MNESQVLMRVVEIWRRRAAELKRLGQLAAHERAEAFLHAATELEDLVESGLSPATLSESGVYFSRPLSSFGDLGDERLRAYNAKAGFDEPERDPQPEA